MEKRNYVVCRDNIYVGEVVRAGYIHRTCYYDLKGSFLVPHYGDLYAGNYKSYRSMLFVPNQQNLAEDLLYNSPNYPIINITDDNTCVCLEEDSIVIKDACNLAPLLEYFNYNKELTYKDILKIRRTFFTGTFAQDNSELFGLKEKDPEKCTYYQNGKEITDPKELKRIIDREKRLQQMGHRSFVSISENVLPREYFDILDDRGDNTLIDVLEGWDEKLNAFKPHRKEGPIKKITRF